MRTVILCLFLLTTAVTAAQAQHTQARPQQPLTADQSASQETMKAFYSKLDHLRTAANAAYTAEMAREKAGDCPNAKTTADSNTCLSNEDAVTAANYQNFISAVRAIIALSPPSALTAPGATPATDAAAFDTGEAAWRAYSKAECAAVDVHWRGGTIVGTMIGECRLQITRSRMDQIASDYMGIIAG